MADDAQQFYVVHGEGVVLAGPLDWDKASAEQATHNAAQEDCYARVQPASEIE